MTNPIRTIRVEEHEPSPQAATAKGLGAFIKERGQMKDLEARIVVMQLQVVAFNLALSLVSAPFLLIINGRAALCGVSRCVRQH